VTSSVPHARDDPPWSDCGDQSAPEFGTVFVRPTAGTCLALTYDRLGRRHAVTLFDRRALASEIVLEGRRFDVAFVERAS